ncbi:uncharacterized protein TM35_000073630 [Trypanosoma theileri]|uniref:Uncharacterized protein n=1 Tax=Trypanosoma theileri TaxID=67003 RepID=A0A1X0P301_9TRYP|nr:uncharacterized protein TM35_000073630 [Trypanosoma theileri]ORC90939.1 hypothetical protein TM35_000073630 [Trypanosoma theileri]
MPVPPASFTRSKWLAFFAELTAKITHHNIMVVLEGCEVLKRILISQVSIAAFLEEGALLTHFLDTIAGDALSNERREYGPSLAMAERLLFTQLETLSLFIDMMVALHADKDPYYCLLVIARAGDIVLTLVRLLQRQQPRFFGLTAMLLKSLLTLPLGKEVRDLYVDEKQRSVALMCHLQKLQKAVSQQEEILQETVEILQTLGITTDGPMQYCSQFLFNMALHRLVRLQKAKKRHHNTSENDSLHMIGLNKSEPTFADRSTEYAVKSQNSTFMNINTTTTTITETDAPTPAGTNETKVSIDLTDESLTGNNLEGVEISIPENEYIDCFERLSKCRSHEEFFYMMNRLWCLTVAAEAELRQRFTSVNFDSAFKRFLQTMPLNQQDQMLFTSVLLWLSHVISDHYLSDNTRDHILNITGNALITLLRDSIMNPTPISNTSNDANSNNNNNNNNNNSSSSSIMSNSTIGLRLVGLSFLLVGVGQWPPPAGLLALLTGLINTQHTVRTAQLNAPNTPDGGLPDEVYLAAAAEATRSEHITVATLACKLLAAVVGNHYKVLCTTLTTETCDMLQNIIPLLLKISINNPTLASAVENISGSALHYLPSCYRSSRYTSLGECSMVALDACFWLMDIGKFDTLKLKDIISHLPALSRATRNSIHPPLRASVDRCLARLCRSTEDLLTVLHEMPSVFNAAITSILEYSSIAPQWETAAAAEWLDHVIEIAKNDIQVEQSFDFSRTALPIKLLELASSNGITYATAAMLSLTVALFHQEKRFADYHHNHQETSTSVIIPYGRRSLDCWFKLIQVATQSSEKLAHVCEKSMFSTSSSKDALSRLISSIEGISVQFSFVCSLARGLLLLITSYPEYRDHFAHHMMYGLFLSAFSLPSPDDIFEMLFIRFGVKVEQHDLLERSYENMLQWMIELASQWFNVTTTTTTTTINTNTRNIKNEEKDKQSFPTLPSVFYDHLCKIMKNDRISQGTRVSISTLVSIIMMIPSNSLREVLSTSSGDLFSASLSLKSISCVSGMQCRLVLLFKSANEKAHTLGWFEAKVMELEGYIKTLKRNNDIMETQEMDLLLMSLSFVCSVIASPHSPTLSQEILHSFSASLRTALGNEKTQRAAFQAAAALAKSEEGRRCLLHEVTTSGEPLARSCFGRILGITVGVMQGGEHHHYYPQSPPPSSSSSATQLQSSSSSSLLLLLQTSPSQQQIQKETNNCMKRSPVSERDSSRAAITMFGFDICATTCGKGGEVFTHNVMKLKGVEHIEALLLRFERQRTSAPLGLYRFLAAISFHAEAQVAIIRQTELITIVIEAATSATRHGTLALLTLRNLCFNPSLKTQVCQDQRILLTLKAALLAQPTLQPVLCDNNTPETREKMKTMLLNMRSEQVVRKFAEQAAASRQVKKNDHENGGMINAHTSLPTGSFDTAEILRRQELAVTAFWSLMYDNQRSKSYVRGFLNQDPVVNINKLVMPSNSLTTVSPDLQKYPEKMTEAIGNIKLLGKGAI